MKLGEVLKEVTLTELSLSEFLKTAFLKFGVAAETGVRVLDSSGTEIDNDVFEEVVRNPSIGVLTITHHSDVRQMLDDEAKRLVETVLTQKPGGDHIISEYSRTQSLADETRRKLVNILAADMTEKYGTSPSRQVKETYARGIVSLFPFLRDPFSKNGFEQFYNSLNSSGFLSSRIKQTQKSEAKNPQTGSEAEGPSAEDSSGQHSDNPKPVLNLVPEAALSEAEFREVLSLMNRTMDEDTVRRTMKQTFVQRRHMVLDSNLSLNLLLEFPRFKDVKGLIEQDFALMFGEDVSGKLLERWPTTFKKKVIDQCRNLPSVKEFSELLQAADPPEDHPLNSGVDSDLASVLLLLHLIPPTAQGRKRPGKVSASQAQKHLVVFEKPGTTLQQHLSRLAPSSQPYLLALGPDPGPQRFFVVFRDSAVPCWSRSSLGAFDELFKAHFVFGAAFHPMLCNMYTFIQTTVFNIDVGKVKESPRVAEVRARLLN